MRIIAGTYKSRILKTLKGDTTRPSSDRLKEALFNRIGPYFHGGHFLDVFAGSGAVGLEALSRGMDRVTFVEKDAQAQKVIINNIKTLDVSSQTELIRGDIYHVSMKLKGKYDIIFMDPPYHMQDLKEIVDSLLPYLNVSGQLIIETEKNTVLNIDLKLVDERVYGLAKLSFYEMP